MNKPLLKKLETANIIGRGGAGFSTAKKWQYVKAAKEFPKYVICNASEGELGLFKDIYILKHYPQKVFAGMIHAMDFLETKQAYFNINKNYLNDVGDTLNKIILQYKLQGYNFKIFAETPSYIGGEETALLNAIEGKRIEPRLKPPYPASHGLFNKPTLVHNVETLYNIALVAKNKFEDKRFYSISGKVPNPGVFYYPATWTIQKILTESNNWNENKGIFAQIGGSASGPVMNKKQLKTTQVGGAGSIEVYDIHTNALSLLQKWFKFYQEESCGKCSPCREGTYQLYKLVQNATQDNIPWNEINKITNSMQITSLCALGRSLAIPVNSYIKNILKHE